MPPKYQNTKAVPVNASMDQHTQGPAHIDAHLEQSPRKQPTTGPPETHHELPALHSANTLRAPANAAVPHSPASNQKTNASDHTYSGARHVAERANRAYKKATMQRWLAQCPSDEPWNTFSYGTNAADAGAADANHKRE